MMQASINTMTGRRDIHIAQPSTSKRILEQKLMARDWAVLLAARRSAKTISRSERKKGGMRFGTPLDGPPKIGYDRLRSTKQNQRK